MNGMSLVYLDIYLNGRFYCQLRYYYRPVEKNGLTYLTMPDLTAFVEMKKPYLKGKDFKIHFSLQGL